MLMIATVAFLRALIAWSWALEMASASVFPRNIISTAKNDSKRGCLVTALSPRPTHLMLHGMRPM